MANDDSRQATLTVREAAAALRVSQAHVREAIRTGGIPDLRFGCRIVMRRAAFERMLGTD
jgi:excisionase family DNA binding protein